MLLQLLLVGLGGMAGSMARYGVSSWLQTVPAAMRLPVGTLAVNLFGCFAVGIASQLFERTTLMTPEHRALVVTGFLGGFTTYSAFASEAMVLVRSGDVGMAAGYVSAHVVLGLGAVWLGRLAALPWAG